MLTRNYQKVCLRFSKKKKDVESTMMPNFHVGLFDKFLPIEA